MHCVVSDERKSVTLNLKGCVANDSNGTRFEPWMTRKRSMIVNPSLILCVTNVFTEARNRTLSSARASSKQTISLHTSLLQNSSICSFTDTGIERYHSFRFINQNAAQASHVRRACYMHCQFHSSCLPHFTKLLMHYSSHCYLFSFTSKHSTQHFLRSSRKTTDQISIFIYNKRQIYI